MWDMYVSKAIAEVILGDGEGGSRMARHGMSGRIEAVPTENSHD